MRITILFILLISISCNSSTNYEKNLTQIVGHDRILAFVYYKNGKAGLLDTNQKVVLPAQFDYIEHWQVDGLIPIDSGGKRIDGGDYVGYEYHKYGLINLNGEVLFRPQFDDMSISDHSARVRVDSLYGFIDNRGKWLIKPKFKVATPFYKGTAVVEEAGHFKLINKQDKPVINQLFDSIWNFKNDVAIVEKDKKVGFINFKGKFVLPLDNYTGISEYNWYYGVFSKDEKWYILDTAGRLPVEDGFENVDIRREQDATFAIGVQNGRQVKVRLP